MIKLTPKAADKIRKNLERAMEAYAKNISPAPPLGYYFGAKAGGCSGFQYIFRIQTAPNKNYTVLELSGAKIFVDSNPKILAIIDDTEIDLSDNLLEGFIFNNPRAKASCGCGTSFELRDKKDPKTP